MEKKDFLYTVILTTTVFAALITSIANIIISLINSYRLKHIEEQKKLNEIDKYRYSRLHEILINWHKYDSEIKGETDSEIAFYRLLNQFMDDLGRYEIAKPLLDAGYTEELENKKGTRWYTYKGFSNHKRKIFCKWTRVLEIIKKCH